MKHHALKPRIERHPLADPISGDLFEKDGERRSVVLHRREGDVIDAVFYLRFCTDGTQAVAPATHYCTISEWRNWAIGAEILHSAVRPFKPKGAGKPSRRLRVV